MKLYLFDVYTLKINDTILLLQFMNVFVTAFKNRIYAIFLKELLLILIGHIIII